MSGHLRRVRSPGRAFAVAAHPCRVRKQAGIAIEYSAIDVEPGLRRRARRIRRPRRGRRQRHPAAEGSRVRVVQRQHRTRARAGAGEHADPQRRRLARRQHRRRRPGARPDRTPRPGPARAPHLLLGAGGWRTASPRPASTPASATCSSSTAPPRAPTRWLTCSASPAACIRAISTTCAGLAIRTWCSTPPPRRATAAISRSAAAHPARPAQRGGEPELWRGGDPIPRTGARRARSIDGLGMLVEQAAEASRAGTARDPTPTGSTANCARKTRGW